MGIIIRFIPSASSVSLGAHKSSISDDYLAGNILESFANSLFRKDLKLFREYEKSCMIGQIISTYVIWTSRLKKNGLLRHRNTDESKWLWRKWISWFSTISGLFWKFCEHQHRTGNRKIRWGTIMWTAGKKMLMDFDDGSFLLLQFKRKMILEASFALKFSVSLG